MSCHSSVCCLELEFSVGRYQHGGHHCQRAEGGGNHVGHNVAVIVLARPDVSALTSDNAGDRVVDKGVEILYAKLLKLFLVVLFINILENELEGLIVFLRDSILG